MNLVLGRDACIWVDLKATGLLRAFGHDPTLRAFPDAFELPDVEPGGNIDLAISARFAAERIEVPADMPSGDRHKMLDNLHGSDVLDVRRWAAIDFRGQYRGTVERGTLEGDLVVRGAPHRVSMPISITKEGEAFRARGEWTGTLRDLGIKSFKALMGALKLEDWARLRLDAVFRPR
jgi:hypothetical protein